MKTLSNGQPSKHTCDKLVSLHRRGEHEVHPPENKSMANGHVNSRLNLLSRPKCRLSMTITAASASDGNETLANVQGRVVLLRGRVRI